MKQQTEVGGKSTKKRLFLLLITGFMLICALIAAGIFLVPQFTKHPDLKQAEKLYNNYDLPAAYEVLSKAVKKYPEQEALNYLLLKTVNTSYSFIASDYEFPESASVIEKITDNFRNSKNGSFLAEIGYYYWLKNDREKSREFWEKALEIKPGDYQLFNYLANYYYNTDFPKSISYYEKLFKAAPASLNFIGIKIADEYIIRKILHNKKTKSLVIETAAPDLLKGIGSLQNLEVLSLSRAGLTDEDLPYLAGLKKIKVLSLYTNNLTHITGFKTFPGLKLLYLSNNRISRLENLEALPGLRTLDLRNNRITKFENLDALKSLKYLYLRYNGITRLENLDHLGSLELLDLYNNRITKLENLDRLSALKSLNLYFNSIPVLENLSGLTSLEYFYLRGNAIAKLENLSALTKLKSLDLYENPVAKLENLEALVNLENLVLYGGKISRIENLDTLVKLESLDLRYNQITRIENLGRLTNLKMLYLSYNKISRLEEPGHLANLQNLYISYNRDIPKIENLAALTSLEHLYIGGAQITRIENLDTLVKLKTLYLSDNRIGRLENLDKLTDLETLNLGTNQISRLENLEHLTRLKTLDLYNNQIAKLENLGQLTSLQYLYLPYNNIGTAGDTVLELPASFASLKGLILNGPAYVNPGAIESIKGMENLVNIEDFEFAYQDLRELPDMPGLTHMRSLLLEKNTNLPQIDFRKFPVTLEKLTLWNVNLKNLDGIEYLVNLKELWIGDNPGLTTLSRLNDLKSLKRLNTALCTNLPAAEITKLDNIEAVMIPADLYPAAVIKSWEDKGITVATF